MAPQQESVAVQIRTSSHDFSNSAGDQAAAQTIGAVADTLEDFVGLYDLDVQEKAVTELKDKNINLKKQVIMFQKLMRDKVRLDRVVEKLEKENLISD